LIDDARFWRFVEMSSGADDCCWNWRGGLRDDGRGRFFQGHEMLAHHAAWELRHGYPVPEGLRLRLECGNVECVRHWELDRQYRKLDAREVAAIRASRLPSGRLATMYRVDRRHIWKIKAGLARRT